MPEGTSPAPAGRKSSERMPRLVITTKEHEVIEQMRASLSSAAEIYKRGKLLVRVCADDGTYPEGIDRPAEAPTIRMLGKATLRSELTKLADYARIKKILDDGTLVYESSHPPAFGVDALMEMTSWPVPHLEGVVEAPVLLRNGKILDTVGYDAYSGLYLRPQEGARFLPVSMFPTAEDIANALAWLKEAVIDFPFEVAAGRSAWLAGLLSYFARPAYEGHTPAFLIVGNARGVGKGKLVTTAAQVCVGRKPMVIQQAPDEKAEREALTAVALSGETVVLIDNIAYPLGSAALDSVLTEGVFTQILKYKNDPTTFRLKAIWWGDGNQIQFKKNHDMVRRSLMISINSPHEHPEQRDDFKRPEPEYSRWVRAHRPELVWAALTLLRGYVAAGRPKTGIKPWGSFEGWSALVREALVWAGEPDPYEVAAVHDQTADSAAEAIGGMLRGLKVLLAEVKSDALTAHEVIAELRCHIENSKSTAGSRNPHEGLISALCELSPPKSGRLPEPGALGYAFRKIRNRVVGGRRLEGQPGPETLTVWSVAEVTT